MSLFRWGILGTGNIAARLAESLGNLAEAELLAVGSRSQAGAERFGKAWDIPRRYSSYQALVTDPDIDAVYVATPHPFHCENTLLALEHGKHVLCEKPFALNASEAARMIAKAREQKLFLMEAMWTRFLPAMVKLRELLAGGVLGEVELVQAEFGFKGNIGPEHRLLNPALGGGSLLDVGIYPISFAFMVLGKPDSTQSDALIGPTGVDEAADVMFEYSGERRAELASAINQALPNAARVYGSEGYVEVTPNFWQSQKLILFANDREEHLSLPFEGHGDQFQAIELMDCVRQGKQGSDTMPLDESLSIMQTLDEIRAQWGLRYPSEAQDA